MKIKDHFLKLKSQARIENDELNKFIEAAPDLEIPDSVVAILEENFLTRERAKTDKEVNKKVRAEVMDGVDHSLSQLYTLVSVDEADKISKEERTYERISLVKKGIEGALERAKAANPDRDKKLEEAEKQLRIEADKIQAIKTEYDKKLKDSEDNHTQAFKKMKIDSALMGLVDSFELAKEYADDPEVKKDTRNIIISKINRDEIDFDENGQLIVQTIENGVAKPKFNGNDRVTVDKLLETASAKYLKKNNAGDKGGKEASERKTKVEVPRGQETLGDRRKAYYAS